MNILELTGFIVLVTLGVGVVLWAIGALKIEITVMKK